MGPNYDPKNIWIVIFKKIFICKFKIYYDFLFVNRLINAIF